MSTVQDHVRRTNAQNPSTLVDTIARLNKTNFHDKLMASGVLITITDLEGKSITPEFMLAGEDLELVKVPIVHSIKAYLSRQLISLKAQVKSVENILDQP